MLRRRAKEGGKHTLILRRWLSIDESDVSRKMMKPKREGTQSLMGQVVSKRQAEIYWKRHRIDVARSAQLKKQLDQQRGRQ